MLTTKRFEFVIGGVHEHQLGRIFDGTTGKDEEKSNICKYILCSECVESS
jgi:hypothetical protein